MDAAVVIKVFIMHKVGRRKGGDWLSTGGKEKKKKTVKLIGARQGQKLREGSFFHLMLQSNNKGGGGGPTEIRGKNFFFVTMAGKSGFFQQQELVHFGRLTPPQCGRIPEMQMRVFSDVHVHCALLLQ